MDRHLNIIYENKLDTDKFARMFNNTRLVGLCIKEAEELNKKNIFLNGTYT